MHPGEPTRHSEEINMPPFFGKKGDKSHVHRVIKMVHGENCQKETNVYLNESHVHYIVDPLALPVGMLMMRLTIEEKEGPINTFNNLELLRSTE